MVLIRRSWPSTHNIHSDAVGVEERLRWSVFAWVVGRMNLRQAVDHSNDENSVGGAWEAGIERGVTRGADSKVAKRWRRRMHLKPQLRWPAAQ